MNRRLAMGSLLVAAAGLAAAAIGWRRRQGALPPQMALAPRVVLSPPDSIGAVYHLGHSLVGRDMPAMLAQFGGHGYASQLGWGTPLQTHWTEGEALPGYELHASGIPPAPARQALAADGFDVLVMTEMVEIRDSLRYFDSPYWLAEWAALARQGNPAIRIYLYETWHNLDDPDGWLERIDADLEAHWLGRVIAPAEATGRSGGIFLIPGGQAMAAVARAAEAGDLPGLTSRGDLFARTEDGGLDTIHINDLGAYVVALTHWAVMYQRSPVGLPHQMQRADGSVAQGFGPEAALRVQQLVRDVVAALPQTGVAPARMAG
ncbi:MAG: hypothetical protein ACK41U_05290 [Paracoccus sp. (in: a-proteobacteria)]|uniref:hypothetical protein n=1 Tax=Paracoccus sp. TaxID=267 RepID=UPI00391DAB78